MDRRRSGAKTRPPTADELQHWGQTRTALTTLATLRAKAPIPDTFAKVNKRMESLRPDEAVQPDGFENIKHVKSKLTQDLNDIKSSAEQEAKILSDALEHLQRLISLRRGPEGGIDKRKRARVSSPSSLPGSPRTSSHPQLNLQSTNGAVPHHGIPGSATSVASSGGRSSQGPQGSFHDPRSKREWLNKQLPLQAGRKVAFRQPQQSKGNGRGGMDLGVDGDGETWILAVVKRSLGQDKQKYEVQDDDTEDGEPGQKYNTTVKSLIPLPDASAPLDSPQNPLAYGEFSAGTSVLGLYPDTSCFYKAIVVAGPRDPSPKGSTTPKHPAYRLKFEDDDDYVRSVGVEWVVEAPH